MTFPITPNPAIHTQPKGIRQQQMLFSGGQLEAWKQSLPLGMTLQLMDAILKALGVSQTDIDAYNNDATTYYNSVQTKLGTVNTDLAALQADSSASTAAFSTLLTSWEAAITGYTNWSTFITALETAWDTYSTTESGLTSSAIFTLQNLFNTLLRISPSTGLMAPTNVSNVLGGSSLGADVSSVHTTAVNGTAWATRLTNDLLITSDVFHLVYNAGTSTDAPGTLGVGGVGAGKPTWYSAWNDLLALSGVVNSTTAPTDAAPTTGTVIQANTAAATTAGTNASIAIAANQATSDAIATASSGAPVTGSTPTDVVTALTNIPATNVVGGTGAAVAFGAVGGGNAVTGSTSSLSTSWSHSIAAGDGEVLIGISYAANAASTWSSSCTYNGSSAGVTLLASIPAATAVVGTKGYTDVYVLKAPPSGSKTVAVSVTRLTGSGTVVELHGNSISYAASKVGTVNTYTGGGSTALSMTAASATGKMVVGFFTSYVNNNNVLSSFSQTERYNRGFITAGLASDFGDAAGAGSVVFTAASPYSTQQYCGVTVEVEN